MEEKIRITKLFEDLFEGDPWIDVNIMDTLSTVSPEQAARKPGKKMNSIWEIVHHMISWRENVLQRLQGKNIETPAHNYFETIGDASPQAWEKILQRFSSTQNSWLSFLAESKPRDLEKVYAPNGMTYQYHIHGILQHDAYHLGQIVLLAKHF